DRMTDRRGSAYDRTTIQTSRRRQAASGQDREEREAQEEEIGEEACGLVIFHGCGCHHLRDYRILADLAERATDLNGESERLRLRRDDGHLRRERQRGGPHVDGGKPRVRRILENTGAAAKRLRRDGG